jgi:PPOX class probable F420-dependent enzyme
MAETVEGRARELLEEANFSMTATIRRDGSPHVVPTWVDVDDNHVLLNTAEGRAWPANLRRDNRITITVPDKDNPYEYVEIRGRLSDEDHEGADAHADKMAKKYLGQEKYPFKQPGEQRVVFRIAPDWVNHYGG